MNLDFSLPLMDTAPKNATESPEYRRSALHYSNRQELPTMESSGIIPVPLDEINEWARDEKERKGRRRKTLFT